MPSRAPNHRHGGPWRALQATCALAVLTGCGKASPAPASAPQVTPVDPTPSEPNALAQGGPTPPTDEFAVARTRACPSTASMERLGGWMCDGMICQGSFRLHTYPQAAWPHGQYKFVFTLDTQTVTCEGELPLKSCDVRSVVCDAPGIHISESGCALDASQHAFGEISFDAYPLQVRVELLRDGVRIANATYTPAYQASQIKGPNCSIPCCGASADFTVPSGR